MCSAVKTYLRDNNDALVDTNNDIPLFNGKRITTVSCFRKELVNMNTDNHCSISFWKRKLDVNILNTNWSVAYKSTQETRLRLLHLKIMHNIYQTNILLCKMKVKEKNKCSYCYDVVDFIEHFLFDCPCVYDFWKFIEQFILHSIDTRIKLQVTDILFGMELAGESKSKCITLVELVQINLYRILLILSFSTTCGVQLTASRTQIDSLGAALALQSYHEHYGLAVNVNFRGHPLKSKLKY